jgi:hypothetical protein
MFRSGALLQADVLRQTDITAIVTRDRMMDMITPVLGSSAGAYPSRGQRMAMMVDCEAKPLQSDQRAMFRLVSKDSEGKKILCSRFLHSLLV